MAREGGGEGEGEGEGTGEGDGEDDEIEEDLDVKEGGSHVANSTVMTLSAVCLRIFSLDEALEYAQPKKDVVEGKTEGRKALGRSSKRRR
jgi:hypothetical protein